MNVRVDWAAQSNIDDTLSFRHENRTQQMISQWNKCNDNKRVMIFDKGTIINRLLNSKRRPLSQTSSKLLLLKYNCFRFFNNIVMQLSCDCHSNARAIDLHAKSRRSMLIVQTANHFSFPGETIVYIITWRRKTFEQSNDEKSCTRSLSSRRRLQQYLSPWTCKRPQNIPHDSDAVAGCPRNVVVCANRTVFYSFHWHSNGPRRYVWPAISQRIVESV